jgi:hypothetical protein
MMPVYIVGNAIHTGIIGGIYAHQEALVAGHG